MCQAPDLYKERTPQERSAAIQSGAIKETTPIPVGERIVDNVFRDWKLSGDPVNQAKWKDFQSFYAPAADAYQPGAG